MYTEQSNTDEMRLKESCRDAPPAKRARQVTKDRRLAHLVEAYNPDDEPLVQHLDNGHAPGRHICVMSNFVI